MMKMPAFKHPNYPWERKPAAQLGFSEKSLENVANWIQTEYRRMKYRIIVLRHGYIVAEWQKGINTNTRLSMASAAKSLYSSILGIAIEEGKIPSIDAKLIDYYPEYMEVKEGEGPKPGRFAKTEDKEITFRQLITNMSGYMKPGEPPDSRFHYQTFGMNILSHAIAKSYGYYDSKHPRKLPGFRKLIDDKIKKYVGGSWKYKYTNFKHPKNAKTSIFGNYTGIEASARDMARMGYLWLNWGNWGGNQLIPETYLREATKTAPNIKTNCPEHQWRYGYAFWTNDHGKLWPNLPRDSYSASGATQKNIWVCPSLDLVVAQSPGFYRSQTNPIFSKVLDNIIESLKK